MPNVVTQVVDTELAVVETALQLATEMVRSVAKTGSSGKNTDVLVFQTFWNAHQAELDRAFYAVSPEAFKAGRRWFKLVEDGGYGPNTSKALWFTAGNPQPPTRASGMPTWYAQNRATVDVWAQFQPTTAASEGVVSQQPPTTESVNAATQAVISNSGNASGATIQQVIATPAEGVNTSSTPAIGADPRTWGPVKHTGDFATDNAAELARIRAIEVYEAKQDSGRALVFNDQPIASAKKKSGAVFYAIALAGVVAGGYWFYKRKRR